MRTGVTATVATSLMGVLVSVGDTGVAERLGRAVYVAAGVFVAVVGVAVRVDPGCAGVGVAVGGTGVLLIVAVGKGVSVGDGEDV